MKLRYFAIAVAALVWASPVVAQHGHWGGAQFSHFQRRGTQKDDDPKKHKHHKHKHYASDDRRSPSIAQSGRHRHQRATVAGFNRKIVVPGRPELSSRLNLLLEGADLSTASVGFKNFGQFVAAAHVSRNLGISFAQVKARVVGPPRESLGTAIAHLRPNADTAAEAARANRQAEADLDLDTPALAAARTINHPRDLQR